MVEKHHDLDGAYALKTPEDSVRFYRDWAESYDRDFADGMDYRGPKAVSEVFAALGGAGPILDVGAGTGLVGVALRELGAGPIDGVDISAEMLMAAAAKGVYRATIVADLTKELDLPDSSYSGIISAGTFTTGHVGPEAFEELLRVAAPGAVFAVTVHSSVYDAAGFAAKFREFGDRIDGFRTEPFRIYGPKVTGDHADDTGWIVSFRKT